MAITEVVSNSEVNSVPEVSFAHLAAMTDAIGVFEHAEHSEPRRHLGYCVDDVARALVVVARQPSPDPWLLELGTLYLSFVLGAQDVEGRFSNRRRQDGEWDDRPIVADWWGRALWALGTAASRSPDGETCKRALAGFAVSARLRSTSRRSMAFAALGAAEILDATPGDRAASSLLGAVPSIIGRPSSNRSWPWPEPRLAYANAALPEALLAVGEHLGDDGASEDGLRLLSWLLKEETRNGHLSVTPSGGWRRGEARPGFDQQPIEVSTLADACARAYRLTGEAQWTAGLKSCVAWFVGRNDAGCAMYDPSTGGGFDGLEVDGHNDNQGAESTLALISTLQLAALLPMSHLHSPRPQ